MLVRLLQNRLIFSKIRQENILKIGHIFFIIFCFLERSTQKFVRKSCKICQFSANLSLKILQNLTFFSAIYQRPWLAHSGLSDKGQCKMQTVDWLRTIVVRVRKQWNYCCLILICMVKIIVCSLSFTLTVHTNLLKYWSWVASYWQHFLWLHQMALQDEDGQIF